MKRLTQKQFAFCAAYVETQSPSEAYKRAYNAAKMKASTIYQRSNDLMNDPAIQAGIAELRRPVAEAAKITLESYLAELYELRQAALERGQISAAVQATVARGKAAGVAIDRAQIEANIKAEVSAKPVSSTRIYDARTGRTIKETFDDGRVITYEPDCGPVQVCAEEAPQIFVSISGTDEKGQTRILDLPDNGRDDDINEAVARTFSGKAMERIVCDVDADGTETRHIFQYPDNRRSIE